MRRIIVNLALLLLVFVLLVSLGSPSAAAPTQRVAEQVATVSARADAAQLGDPFDLWNRTVPRFTETATAPVASIRRPSHAASEPGEGF